MPGTRIRHGAHSLDKPNTKALFEFWNKKHEQLITSNYCIYWIFPHLGNGFANKFRQLYIICMYVSYIFVTIEVSRCYFEVTLTAQICMYILQIFAFERTELNIYNGCAYIYIHMTISIHIYIFVNSFLYVHCIYPHFSLKACVKSVAFTATCLEFLIKHLKFFYTFSLNFTTSLEKRFSSV